MIEKRMSLKKFQTQFSRDMKKLQSTLKKGVMKTARDAVPIIRDKTPKAFGDLRHSIHSDDDRTVIDAPHACAVEVGSRPHLVPLKELTKWVKLRGMQGLTKGGRIKTSLANANHGKIGSTTALHALSVASELKSMERSGSLAIDAAEQIARRIQQKILKSGTHPHWYVRQSLPAIRKVLGENIAKALAKALV
jgi:hypothetical protein